MLVTSLLPPLVVVFLTCKFLITSVAVLLAVVLFLISVVSCLIAELISNSALGNVRGCYVEPIAVTVTSCLGKVIFSAGSNTEGGTGVALLCNKVKAPLVLISVGG